MHKRGSHFIKKLRFLRFSGIFRNIFVLGVISGNINPPGGCRGQIPGFWKPRFQPKVSLETVWSIFVDVFCYLSETDNSVALTFQGGSYEYGDEIYCI